MREYEKFERIQQESDLIMRKSERIRANARKIREYEKLREKAEKSERIKVNWREFEIFFGFFRILSESQKI